MADPAQITVSTTSDGGLKDVSGALRRRSVLIKLLAGILLLAIIAIREVRGDLVDEIERWREKHLNIRARWSRCLTACRWRSRMYC